MYIPLNNFKKKYIKVSLCDKKLDKKEKLIIVTKCKAHNSHKMQILITIFRKSLLDKTKIF